MSALKEQLRSDLTAALKSGDADTVGTIRMALAAISKEEVAGKSARELSDDDVVVVLTGEVKRRKEAAAAYRDAQRPELAAQELAEADVLAAYLPAPLSRAEVDELISAAVAGAESQGLSGGRAMGAVMKELKPATTGRFDGAELAALVKQALGM
ncbi:MAG: GatB/YqeY domain-containing protein [Candidatus Nanopelagicales bacterium]